MSTASSSYLRGPAKTLSAQKAVEAVAGIEQELS